MNSNAANGPVFAMLLAMARDSSTYGCVYVSFLVAGLLCTPIESAAANPRTVPLQAGQGSGASADAELGPLSPTRVAAPIPAAHCDIHVVDDGVDEWIDTETDYVPHVVQCENGGANFEALKAQAIAARSVAYYAMETSGKICDSQGCQVYSCGNTPSQKQLDAVAATAGQYLSFNDTLTYAFYVAGDSSLDPPACLGDDADAGTEKFVTYNEDKTGTNVEQTTLGYIHEPGDSGYGQNRGCMSQWGARCLENEVGYDYLDILRFYYGADIEVQQAEGPCVNAPEPEPPPPVTPGTFELADCQGLRGWIHNPEAPGAPIELELAFDGAEPTPFDDPAATVRTILADRFREDLCDLLGVCEHGFEREVPRSLRDGLSHSVHARYQLSPEAELEALDGAPLSFSCPRLALPEGVRRPVPAVISAAWGFDPFWQATVVSAAELEGYALGAELPETPRLVEVDDDPATWLIDGDRRRRIATLATLTAWGLDELEVEQWPKSTLEVLEEGPPLRPEPFLIQQGGGALHLIDDPPCGDGGCEPSSDASGGGDTADDDGDDTAGDDTGGAGTESGGGALPPEYGVGDDDDGCGCVSAGSGRGGTLGALALLGLLTLRRRRRAPRDRSR